MRYEETPAGALQAAVGGVSQRGRTEFEQRALRAEYEQTMESLQPGWAKRQEDIAAFAVEIRSRGNWISSVGDCPQCATEERSGTVIDRLDHDHVVNDLKLAERLRSLSRIRQAEQDGTIGPMTVQQIADHNARRMAQAQRAVDRGYGTVA